MSGGILGPRLAQQAASLLVSCVHHSVLLTNVKRLQSLAVFGNTVDQVFLSISHVELHRLC